jgi:hypothetical protein
LTEHVWLRSVYWSEQESTAWIKIMRNLVNAIKNVLSEASN